MACSSRLLFNYSVTPAIYILSLHDALPILENVFLFEDVGQRETVIGRGTQAGRTVNLGIAVEVGDGARDRKSTRLNSSHVSISYAVFCLKNRIEINAGLDAFGDDESEWVSQ